VDHHVVALWEFTEQAMEQPTAFMVEEDRCFTGASIHHMVAGVGVVDTTGVLHDERAPEKGKWLTTGA